jgi:hypothetical protein
MNRIDFDRYYDGNAYTLFCSLSADGSNREESSLSYMISEGEKSILIGTGRKTETIITSEFDLSERIFRCLQNNGTVLAMNTYGSNLIRDFAGRVLDGYEENTEYPIGCLRALLAAGDWHLAQRYRDRYLIPHETDTDDIRKLFRDSGIQLLECWSSFDADGVYCRIQEPDRILCIAMTDPEWSYEEFSFQDWKEAYLWCNLRHVMRVKYSKPVAEGTKLPGMNYYC